MQKNWNCLHSHILFVVNWHTNGCHTKGLFVENKLHVQNEFKYIYLSNFPWISLHGCMMVVCLLKCCFSLVGDSLPFPLVIYLSIALWCWFCRAARWRRFDMEKLHRPSCRVTLPRRKYCNSWFVICIQRHRRNKWFHHGLPTECQLSVPVIPTGCYCSFNIVWYKLALREQWWEKKRRINTHIALILKHTLFSFT